MARSNHLGASWRIWRAVVRLFEAFGYVGALLVESLYWLITGPKHGQRVGWRAIAEQLVEVGLKAVPIVAVLSFTVGLSLAIQLIYTLSEFGAESQVVLAIATGVAREFGPLITAILVAGRTASALAARIGSMTVSQEVDALRVMGVEPVRYLVAPPLLALLVMVPTLTIISDFVGILGAGLYSSGALGLSLTAYMLASLDALAPADVLQGLAKSVVFGMIIALVGVRCGFVVRGGAEGVGQGTTQAVVIAISAIVITDMIFTFFMNR